MLNDSLLALANLLTSALTAITGVGGGMILIGLMPFLCLLQRLCQCMV